jgi:serine/threonine protein kinase
MGVPLKSSSMTNDAQPQLPTGPVQLGQIVGGKYRIDGILGASGMGVVYAATHLQMDARVAVKFLLVKSSDHAVDALERFTREAKFMAKIHSEHVVRVIDVGALDATPFIVMELLVGDDLARVLLRQGALPVEVAVDYVLQAAEGLAAAHAAGVVHRDLKPSNLFLTHLDGRDVVKLIDFGVAKYRGGDSGPQSDALTQTHVMIGSPRYMAPEQVRASKDVDARADVWSLAIILQELLTAKPVFKGPSVSDSLVLILTTDPPRVDQLRPEVPSGLADAVARALVKDPTYRTPTVATFASELLPFASMTRRGVYEPIFAHAAVPRVPRTFGADSVSDVSAVAGEPTKTAWGTGVTAPPDSRRAAKVAVAVLAGATVAAGVLVALVLHRHPTATSTAAASTPTSEVAPSAKHDPAPEPTAAKPSEAQPAPAPTPAAAESAATPAEVTPAPAPEPTKAAKVAATKTAPAVATAKATKPAQTATAAASAPPAATEPKPNLFDDPK